MLVLKKIEPPAHSETLTVNLEGKKIQSILRSNSIGIVVILWQL